MTNKYFPTPKVEIKLQERWMPVFAAIAVILHQIVAGRFLMALGLIVGGSWLLGLFWARSLAGKLRLDRQRKYGWSQVGDVFEEKVILRNDGVFPASWLLIEDHSTLIGHSISVGTGIGGGTSRRWTKRTPCAKRGEFQLGPTTIFSGDPFGIYKIQINYPEVSDFLVSPPVIPLPQQFDISTGYLMDDRRSTHRRAERSNISVNTRLFAPGDSLLRIHWLTSARQDQPYVRQFENINASDHCWIVLDLDKSVHISSGEHDSVEQSIILTVSLAHKFLLDGVAVGLLAQGDCFALLPPRKGANQFRKIQRLMAIIQPGELSIDQLLLRTRGNWNNATNIVIVTPSKKPDWLNSLIYLRRSQVYASVFIIQTSLDTDSQASGFSRQIDRAGFESHVISPELFQLPESAPGRIGVIDWKFTPLGRAIKIVEEGES
ncbi:MAG: DUF58 domain-containing protein [Anaerolineales bacterium]|nr:DUF58 domain-containing protein [Anaerolineales bacterium]